MLRVVSVKIATDAFDGLDDKTAEAVGHRVLRLSFVSEVDWIGGYVTLKTGMKNLDQLLQELEQHLRAPLARGERVVESYDSKRENTLWGVSGYRYTYEPGDYNEGAQE